MDVDERLPTKYPTLYLAMGSSLTGVGWLPLPDACKARTPCGGEYITPLVMRPQGETTAKSKARHGRKAATPS